MEKHFIKADTRVANKHVKILLLLLHNANEYPYSSQYPLPMHLTGWPLRHLLGWCRWDEKICLPLLSTQGWTLQEQPGEHFRKLNTALCDLATLLPTSIQEKRGWVYIPTPISVFQWPAQKQLACPLSRESCVPPSHSRPLLGRKNRLGPREDRQDSQS